MLIGAFQHLSGYTKYKIIIVHPTTKHQGQFDYFVMTKIFLILINFFIRGCCKITGLHIKYQAHRFVV